MKSFLVCATLAVALAAAEPPRYRQQSRFFARQQEDTTTAPGAEAPYPPSGWKPAGPAFKLPQRQVQTTYGAPEPATVYGPPTTTEAPTNTEAEEPTTTAPEDSGNELDEEEAPVEGQEQQGEYYIALPDGSLQRVQYVSREDAASMRYLAKIQAQNVGPIYSYSPLQKLQLVRPVKVEAPAVVVPVAAVDAGATPPLSTSYTTVTTNYQPSAKLVLAAV